jgi:hypothetical protein
VSAGVTTIFRDGTVFKPAREPDFYLAKCQEETGVWVDEPTLQKRRREALELRAQTVTLADRLEANGVRAYRDDQYYFWFYKIHTGELEELLPFRRCMILPGVAAAVRRPMLKAVEYFLERNPFCRMWVFSSGKRVAVEELRARVRELHRRLSELNSQPFMRDLGVEIVLRSTELGTPEIHSATKDKARLRKERGRFGEIERDDDGRALYHVHAHCLIHLSRGFVRPADWSALVAKVGAFWGHYWSAGEYDSNGNADSIVRNARELCKYVTKPGALLKLSGKELVALFEATRRLKFVQPMGALAEEMRIRDEARPRIVLVKGETSEGRVWREVRNWNTYEGPARVDRGDEVKPPEMRRDSVSVVAKCLPSIGRAGVKEPGLVLRTNFHVADDSFFRTHPLVEQLRAATRERFEGGLAVRNLVLAPIRVHTCTPTVLAVPKTHAERVSRPRAGPANRQFDAERRRTRSEILAIHA